MSSDNQFYKEALRQVQRDSEIALEAQQREQEAFLRMLEGEQDKQLRGFSDQIAQLAKTLAPHLKSLGSRLTALETPPSPQEAKNITGDNLSIVEQHYLEREALKAHVISKHTNNPCSSCAHGMWYEHEHETENDTLRFECLKLADVPTKITGCSQYEAH